MWKLCYIRWQESNFITYSISVNQRRANKLLKKRKKTKTKQKTSYRAIIYKRETQTGLRLYNLVTRFVKFAKGSRKEWFVGNSWSQTGMWSWATSPLFAFAQSNAVILHICNWQTTLDQFSLLPSSAISNCRAALMWYDRPSHRTFPPRRYVREILLASNVLGTRWPGYRQYNFTTTHINT